MQSMLLILIGHEDEVLADGESQARKMLITWNMDYMETAI